MLTVEQETRMLYQKDLVICTVGGRKCHGSLNEYEACRMKKGDKVRYISDGVAGNGKVDFVWFYDGPVVNLIDGKKLVAAIDLIEKVSDEST